MDSRRRTWLVLWLLVGVLLTSMGATGCTQTRVETVTETQPIDFTTMVTETESLAPGEQRVMEVGHPGELQITYEVTYEGDEVVSKKVLDREVLKQPNPQRISVGIAPAVPEQPAKSFIVGGATVTIVAVGRSSTNFNEKVEGDFLYVTYSVDNTAGTRMVEFLTEHPAIVLPNKVDEPAMKGRRQGQICDNQEFAYVKIGENKKVRVQYTLGELDSIRPNEAIATPSDIGLWVTSPQSVYDWGYDQVVVDAPLSEYWSDGF